MELNAVKEVSPSCVVVVGAGPTGLVLALDLARRGVHAVVLEQADRLFPGSRGKGLQPRTMEVFDDLGVIDAVLAASGPVPQHMAWRTDGTRIGEFDTFGMTDAKATEAEPYSGCPRLLPQWRTQELLYERLRELGGEVVFGAEVTGLEQDADGVTVTFTAKDTAGGTDEGTPKGTAEASTTAATSLRAAYAVAADGGRSTVRRLLGVPMTGETVDPAPFLVADVRLRPAALDRLNWHAFAEAADGLLAICPLPGTEDFQLFARYADESAVPDPSPDGLRRLIAARTHLAPDDVIDVPWASVYRPRAALADRFREGRVFLAGDAAHVHSPAGGQGLNTSVQDAYNLGWKLGQVLCHGAEPALLDTYEQERRPVAAAMLGLSTRIHRGEQQRGRATQQLDLGYRESPLSTGAAGALHSGDRAPDGRLPDGRRIFDALRGPGCTLLAVGVPAPDGSLPVPVHTLPEYEPYGTGLFLIRPDGYVGWASTGDPRGLARWLHGIGIGVGVGAGTEPEPGAGAA
jgi:2-polyprenyl-6-methoxyphenol hydroxylase-like FAD-dependent oxidoreductase